jgi:hypothetical protein
MSQRSRVRAPHGAPSSFDNVACILGRVVKALDLSPSGHSPRGFEPRSMQQVLDTACISWRHRVRVVKELVLKANGLCPREFKSRRCRELFVARVCRVCDCQQKKVIRSRFVRVILAQGPC